MLGWFCLVLGLQAVAAQGCDGFYTFTAVFFWIFASLIFFAGISAFVFFICIRQISPRDETEKRPYFHSPTNKSSKWQLDNLIRRIVPARPAPLPNLASPPYFHGPVPTLSLQVPQFPDRMYQSPVPPYMVPNQSHGHYLKRNQSVGSERQLLRPANIVIPPAMSQQLEIQYPSPHPVPERSPEPRYSVRSPAPHRMGSPDLPPPMYTLVEQGRTDEVGRTRSQRGQGEPEAMEAITVRTTTTTRRTTVLHPLEGRRNTIV